MKVLHTTTTYKDIRRKGTLIIGIPRAVDEFDSYLVRLIY